MSEPELATPLRERAGQALRDPFLQEALSIATTKFIDLRREAFAEFPEGEALRDQARAIKEATLQRLDHYGRPGASCWTLPGARVRAWP